MDLFPSNVKIISTPRIIDGGNSIGNFKNFNLALHVNDNFESVMENRLILKDYYGLPSEPIWLNQTHSSVCINTSRFNNEILKQRLCCIPVHITDDDFPYENYEMFLDEKNDTPDIKFITTEHFKIRDIENDKIMDDSKVKQFFSKNKQKHAAPNHILIDDRKDNIERWEAAGGVGILHTNAKNTIACLKKLAIR